MIRVFWMVLLTGFLCPLHGQIQELDERLSGIDPDNMAQMEGLEEYQIRLEQYRKHPLNLNRATAAELSELGLLSALQIESWIRYRERLGGADHWYVLQGVPGWDWNTLERIRPYVQLIPRANWKQLFQTSEPGKHQLLFRFSTSSSTTLPSQVIGDATHQLIRYKYSSAVGIEAGWMLEKDPGESWRHPDFFSLHMRIRLPGRTHQWTIGDYTIQMGQGLIAWQGMSVASGSDMVSLKKQSQMIRPYQSVGESRFMRGLGMSGAKGRWVWDVFASRKAQTAVLYPIGLNEEAFRSIDASGYHRTIAERSHKKALKENTAGGRLGIQLGNRRLNVNFIARSWDHSQMQLNAPIYGDTSFDCLRINVSVDFSLTKDNWHGFGEGALDGSGNRSLVLGSMWVLHRAMEAGVHLRWIGREFETVAGEILQQRSGVGAEKGFRLQLRWRLNPMLTMDLYGDLYRIPTPHFLVDFPSVGSQCGIRLLYQPHKNRSLYIRILTNAAEESGERSDGVGIASLLQVRKSSIRLHAQWALDTRFQLSVRTEHTQEHGGGRASENGFLHYAELRYDPIGARLRADLRLMWVQTDGWGSRIYAYERNVGYQVGFPAFSGSLLRSYLNVAWKWDRYRTIWFRWAIQNNTDNQSLTENMSLFVQSFTLQFQWDLGTPGR